MAEDFVDNAGRRVDPTKLKSGNVKVGKAGKKPLVLVKKERQLTVLSSVCTHRGCRVTYNSRAKTLDCPCHGSRYNLDGTVLEGPAKKRLPRTKL